MHVALIVAACIFGRCDAHATRSDTADVISPVKARDMIIRFIESSELARGTAWIRASLPIVKRQAASKDPASGVYICGPCQIDPKDAKVVLTSDRAQLIGKYSKTDMEWTITDATIVTIRP